MLAEISHIKPIFLEVVPSGMVPTIIPLTQDVNFAAMH